MQNAIVKDSKGLCHIHYSAAVISIPAEDSMLITRTYVLIMPVYEVNLYFSSEKMSSNLCYELPLMLNLLKCYSDNRE